MGDITINPGEVKFVYEEDQYKYEVKSKDFFILRGGQYLRMGGLGEHLEFTTEFKRALREHKLSNYVS